MDLIIEPMLFLWNIIFTFYYTRVRPQCDYSILGRLAQSFFSSSSIFHFGFGSHIKDGPCDLHDLSGRHIHFGFGSHIEDGPCDLHDLSCRHSRSQQKSDSARTDEDEAFKEQNNIEDPFQPNTARSI